MRVLAGDPNPLAPAGLAMAALQLAQQYLSLSSPNTKGAGTSATSSPAGSAAGSGSGGGCGGSGARAQGGSLAAAHVLLWLAQGAAVRVDARPQQQALLQCALRGRSLGRLRGMLEGDLALQEWCRRELVALSNRMAGGRMPAYFFL
jgi:hypothetical protein